MLGNGRVIGEGAQYLPTGHLVYTQSGGLVATPFDPSSGTLDQPPVPLLERVETSRFGGAYFAVAARSGTLVYVPARALTDRLRSLVWVDRRGAEEPIKAPARAYRHPRVSPDGTRIALDACCDDQQRNEILIWDLQRETLTRLTANRGGNPRSPIWTRDGRSLIFQFVPPEISVGQLYVQAADGSFYGTTFGGGESNRGTIFRFTIAPAQPEIENVFRTGDGLTLAWAALKRRSYQVQFATNLMSQTSWNNLGDPVTTTNTTASATDVIGSDRQRFYRIVLLP